MKRRDLVVVIFGEVRMQQGRRFVRAIQNAGQLFLPGLELAAALLEHLNGKRVLEIEIQDFFVLPFDPFELRLGGVNRNACFHPRLVDLPRKLVTELLEQLRFHQVLVEPVQDGRLERVPANVQPVVAGSLRAGIGASEHVFRNHRITATAAAAFDEAGEEMLRAPAVIQRKVVAWLGSRFHGQLGLPCLHKVPEVLVDDAEFRHILRDPFTFRILPRHALSRIRVFQIAKPVPDQFADIELIVENAGPALRIAMDGRRPPFAALRPWRALAVEQHGDRSGRLAGEILHENPADDIGLGFVDGALAAAGFTGSVDLADDIVAVAEAATGFAVLDPSA